MKRLMSLAALLLCVAYGGPAASANKLGNYRKVVMTPGLFSKGDMSFRSHRLRLGNRGVRSEHNTKLPQRANTGRLARLLAGQGDRLLLVAHSQGGPLALRTLIGRPWLWPRLSGLILIQSPIAHNRHGAWALRLENRGIRSWESRVARFDRTGRWRGTPTRVIRGMSDRMFSLFTGGAEFEAIRELGRQQEFVERHRPAIEDLFRQVPTLTVSAAGDWVVAPEETTLGLTLHLEYGRDVGHFGLVGKSARREAWQWAQFERMVDLLP